MVNWFNKHKRWLFEFISPIAVIGGVWIAIGSYKPLSDGLVWAFKNMGDMGQALVVLAGLILLVIYVIRYVERERRVAVLKEERDQLESQLKSKAKEVEQLAEASIRLAEVEVKEDIWRRRQPQTIPCVDKNQRRARFIALLNLKGGAGKTTLAANVAACLATMDNPLDVLVIDLDFQGTLSNLCVEPTFLGRQRSNKDTAARLLDDDSTENTFGRLLVPMHQVGKAQVIVSDDDLERADDQSKHQFFLKPEEDRRFRFCRILHQHSVASRFDVVLFDCPPRLTTSSVNALTCSDYVLIPTKLEEQSFEAVPRTHKFIQKLGHIARPTILGVVGNEVRYWRGNRLIKPHQNSLAMLRSLVQTPDLSLHVFSAMVPYNTSIAHREEQGLVPSIDQGVRDLFIEVAREIRGRIQK